MDPDTALVNSGLFTMLIAGFGALPAPGGVRFRVWAPAVSSLSVILHDGPAKGRYLLGMDAEGVYDRTVDGVAASAGDRNWGYDGVCLYAPARAYGTPDDLRALVDRAHHFGLSVVLDVVYHP